MTVLIDSAKFFDFVRRVAKSGIDKCWMSQTCGSIVKEAEELTGERPPPAIEPDAAKDYPHQNDIMRAVDRFNIGGRWCCLYRNTTRPPHTQYTMYWFEERNPIQHAMTHQEVFVQLAQLLNPR